MSNHEEKAEIYQAQYPERYTREANTEVHPTVAGMIQFYNKNFSKLRIINVCNMEVVKNY